MNGRVFSDSENLYEDQAKVIYNYLEKVAEKIVDAEMELEERIQGKNAEIQQNDRKDRVSMIVNIVVASVIFIAGIVVPLITRFYLAFLIMAAAGIPVGIYFITRLVNKKKNNELNENIRVFQEEHKNIRRDYKVHKMGVVYVPVASMVPFENQSFMVDHTASTPMKKFSIQEIKDINLLYDTVEGL